MFLPGVGYYGVWYPRGRYLGGGGIGYLDEYLGVDTLTPSGTTKAGGTHPTGMFSCLFLKYNYLHKQASRSSNNKIYTNKLRHDEARRRAQ